MEDSINHLSQRGRTKKYLYGKIVGQAENILLLTLRLAMVCTDTLCKMPAR
ncbi:hypothetical protein BN1221_00190c [Brenneria goodwinii]|uniref:Uncharacterized protein n=1 Tax=Brenneria goodwinii TaxID=1109412 RepID=A0A0G4JPZ7_9GAMM|nr:hypothetical protein BN1221_00190c [Brenneria goodwinii]